MRNRLRSTGWLLCLLALAVAGSAPAQAYGSDQSPRVRPLAPLPGDAESFALGINDFGVVVGHSSSADALSTAVMWDRAGAATALLPLDGDHESFAVAINSAGQVVGHSRNNGDTCPLDTAVMWLPDGSVSALLPLDGARQSVAAGLNDQGMVAGTSKGDPFNEACESVFTPVVWDAHGVSTALSPLDGFPEAYASTVTGSGEVVGGSANVTTGFDFQGTTWRPRKGNGRLLEGPPGSWLNTPANANADGMVVGDTYDAFFTQRAVAWDVEGQPSLRRPLRGDAASLGRAINRRGEVAGASVGAAGSTAVIWSRKGRPTALRSLEGDSQSEAMSINRSGQVVGRSFGAGVSTAVLWQAS